MRDTGQRVGDWALGHTLGTGTTGKVKAAENVRTGERAAIKIIKKSQFATRPDLEGKIHREVALMKLLDHPHLLKLMDCRESPHHLYMILELGANGELFDYLVSKRSLSREEALAFFREIIYGLDYLHQHGICHRDMKPENILLDASKHIKIADFGFARWMKSNIADTSCGSPHYAAPEVVRGLQYDGRMADVWSVGVILFALMAGRLPFDDPSIRVLLSKVKAGRFTMPATFDPAIADLVSNILQVDVSRRLTIEGIKCHPAFLSDLPDGYSVPSPIPLISWTEPIEFDSESFVTLLLSIGYDDVDEIHAEMSSHVHTPAKTFYRMWSGSTAVEALPWPSGGGGAALDWDCTMSPRAFAQSGNAARPFDRHAEIGSLQSPDGVRSFATRAEWIPTLSRLEALAEPATFTGIVIPLAQLMCAVQLFLVQEGFEFFHPDDLHCLARRTGLGSELILRIQAAFVAAGQLKLEIAVIVGQSAEFEDFVEKFRQHMDLTLDWEADPDLLSKDTA
jgi:BR serine/threonine kinase